MIAYCDVTGPYLPLTTPCHRCHAARQTGLSLRLRKQGMGNSQYEPFGALDAKVRKELRQGLREIHDRTGLTTVFVTHDQEEAMELADLVVVMSMGRIEQVGKPAGIRAKPASDFVRDFTAA